jgi:hypothetical protein
MSSPEWIAQSAEDKWNGIWAKVTEDADSSVFHPGVLNMNMDPVFDVPGDEMVC